MEFVFFFLNKVLMIIMVIAMFRFRTILIAFLFLTAQLKLNVGIHGIHIYRYTLVRILLANTRLQLSRTHRALRAATTLKYVRRDTPIISDEDY